MYHTTGCTDEQIDVICGRIAALILEGEDIEFPSSLGLRRSGVIAWTYLTTHRRQAELAQDHGPSPSTISRARTGITPSVARVLTEFVPTADEVDLTRQYVVEGSVLPCWSWRSDPDLYLGKHKTTGMNVQFACTQEGELAWISDPLPGSRHDSHCLRESGALDGFPPTVGSATRVDSRVRSVTVHALHEARGRTDVPAGAALLAVVYHLESDRIAVVPGHDRRTDRPASRVGALR
jgi:hypothetical protein